MTFSIYWCGSKCNASTMQGFATKAEAQAALDRHLDAADAARQLVYGDYSIKEDR